MVAVVDPVLAMSETPGELAPSASDEPASEEVEEAPRRRPTASRLNRQPAPVEAATTSEPSAEPQPEPAAPSELSPKPQPEPEEAETAPVDSKPEQPISVVKPATEAPQPEPEEEEDEPARPQVTAAPTPPRERGGESGGLFNFDDADVYSVIQTIFGDILKVNYIIDQRVKGRVNFRSVAPVAKKDILPLMEVILRLNGIGIVEAEGLYRIVPISDLPKEPTGVGFGREVESIVIEGKALVQIVPVNYVQSSELVRVLTPFLSAQAVIVDVPKSNHIVIVDTDSNVKRLLKLVAIFDSEQLRQIKPEVFVYPVQNTKAKDIAEILRQIFLEKKTTSQTTLRTTPKTAAAQKPKEAKTPETAAETQEVGELLESEDVRIFADETSNSIIVLATRDDYEVIAETIKKIDIVPRQVMLEAMVAEIKLGDDMELGLYWYLKTDFDIGNVINLDGHTGFQPGKVQGTDVAELANFAFAGVDSSGLVRMLIESIARDNKGKVIAAPHILVSDNREARIQIGDQVPIATSETNISGTSQIQRTIQYRDTGIILSVKPQVNEGGLVSLEISQEVSNFSIQSIFDSDQVVISKREAKSNLVVQDGQTVIIGGLIREDTSKAREGIPFLSKIPLLGYLFGNTTHSYDRTELIILLTPRVIRNQKDASDISQQYINRIHEDVTEGIETLELKPLTQE